MKCHADGCELDGTQRFYEWMYCPPHWLEARNFVLQTLENLLKMINETDCPSCGQTLNECVCGSPGCKPSLPN